jgi:hypothetical protein
MRAIAPSCAQPVAGPAVPGGRPRVGVPGGQPHGALALPGHHHRHPAGRRRLQRGVAQLMEAPGPGDRRAAQQRDDDLQLLLEPRPSVAGGNAIHGVLRAGKARAEPEHEPAAADPVDARRHLGQQRGMPEHGRRDQSAQRQPRSRGTLW